MDTKDRLLTVSECVTRLGVGRTKLYELLASGRVAAVKIGSRTYVAASEIERFVRTLPAAAFRGRAAAHTG